MKSNKITEVKGTKVLTLYEGLTYEELRAVIQDYEEPVRDDLLEINGVNRTKKIKKGSFEKSFFRGKQK